VGAVDRQCGGHRAVGHIVEPTIVVGEVMEPRWGPQAGIEIALSHATADDEVAVAIRAYLAQRLDFHLGFAVLRLKEVAIDGELRDGGCAACKRLWSGIEFKQLLARGQSAYGTIAGHQPGVSVAVA